MVQFFWVTNQVADLGGISRILMDAQIIFFYITVCRLDRHLKYVVCGVV